MFSTVTWQRFYIELVFFMLNGNTQYINQHFTMGTTCSDESWSHMWDVANIFIKTNYAQHNMQRHDFPSCLEIHNSKTSLHTREEHASLPQKGPSWPAGLNPEYSCFKSFLFDCCEGLPAVYHRSFSSYGTAMAKWGLRRIVSWQKICELRAARSCSTKFNTNFKLQFMMLVNSFSPVKTTFDDLPVPIMMSLDTSGYITKGVIWWLLE